MSERKRLAELMRTIPYEYLDGNICPWDVADFLLDKGVIFPRAKINQSIWTADPFFDGIPREGYVTSIVINDGYNVYYYSFSKIPSSFIFDDDDIGKTIFFTREEAEKALEKEKI